VASIDSGALRMYRDAPFPPDLTRWRDGVFSVVDLEMTGLDPDSDEIISFATVTVRDGKVRLDDARYELVRPRRMPDWDTIRIHGLREMDLEEAPPLDELMDDLLRALTGRPIVAHVAEVERSFLAAALATVGIELRNPVIDTALLDRELRRLKGQPPAVREPISLGDMVRSLGLPVHRPHHADGDALTTAQAFIALATHLEVFENPLTVQTLERITERAGQHPTPGPIRRLVRRLGL
jgi:DNA polymerase III subunit epsilon